MKKKPATLFPKERGDGPAKCPKCKQREAGRISVEGAPPGACFANCVCGHRWQVCGHDRGNGTRCFQPANVRRLRCRSGGGAEGSGRPITHGRRSKLWERLGAAERADAIRNDPGLRDNRENVSVIERLIEAEGERPPAPPLPYWEDAEKLYDKAMRGDVKALKDLGTVLKDGRKALEADERLLNLMERQRKHIATQNRIEHDAATAVTAKTMEKIMVLILAVITRIVPDQTTRTRLAYELDDVFRSELGAKVLPGSD